MNDQWEFHKMSDEELRNMIPVQDIESAFIEAQYFDTIDKFWSEFKILTLESTIKGKRLTIRQVTEYRFVIGNDESGWTGFIEKFRDFDICLITFCGPVKSWLEVKPGWELLKKGLKLAFNNSEKIHSEKIHIIRRRPKIYKDDADFIQSFNTLDKKEVKILKAASEIQSPSYELIGIKAGYRLSTMITYMPRIYKKLQIEGGVNTRKMKTAIEAYFYADYLGIANR